MRQFVPAIQGPIIVFRAYRSYREFKLRVSPWLALVGGVAFLIWVITDKGSSVGFADLYPGLLLFVASALLFAYIRFMVGPADDETDEADEDDV